MTLTAAFWDYCSSVDVSRRQILIAGAAAAALTTSGIPRSQASLGAIQDQLAALEDRYDAKVGFYGLSLASNRTVAYRADDLFAACSTFKAYVVANALLKDQRGELRLSDEVYIDPKLFVPVASPMTEPNVGGWMSLADLCAAAVRQSDNTATNLMLEILGGPPSVTEFARSIGDDRTWMVRSETELNTALPGDQRDTTSPRGMGTGFLNMLTGGGRQREIVFNVADYGADLTGVTTSDAAFQKVLDEAAAKSAADKVVIEIHIPPGALDLTTRPKVGAGVTIRGAGRGATTIRSSNAAGVLELIGASDIAIADLTVESTATGMAGIGIAGNYAGLQKRVSITNCRITGTTNDAVRFPLAVQQLTFADNLVENCASGVMLYAPTKASGFISTQIDISRNRCRDVGSVNIGLYGGTNPLTVSTIVGVEITGNDLRDFKQTAGYGPIPIEPTCVTNIRIANNTIEGTATNGISTGCNVNMTITGNTIRDQSNHAIELNGGRQISIVGNIAENCTTFASDTGDPALVVPLSDIVIADNVYVGSGRSSAASTDVITLNSARRARISGNNFTDWQYLRSAIRLGNSSATYVVYDCVVEGNTFVVTDANTPMVTVSVATAVRANVARNTFRVKRNLVAGDDFKSVIGVSMDALSSDTLIDGNHVMFTGAVAAAPSASGIGNGNASAAACPGLTVCWNHIVKGPRGLRLVTDSADLAVYSNDTSTCVAADIVPVTALNGPKTNQIRPKTSQILANDGDASAVLNPAESAITDFEMNKATTDSIFDEPHRAQLEEWMRTIVTGDNRIRAGLPPGWTIADKTGTGDYASTNDIGLAFGPAGERLLLAVMTRTRSDDPKAPALNALIADVARVAVPWLLA